MSRYPLLLMLVFLALSWLVYLLVPISFGIGLIPLGGILLGFGALLIVISAGLFRRQDTTVDPSKAPQVLVTHGLYRISRNPMYLGMLLILIGFAFVLNSLLGLLFPVLFFVFMNWHLIPREEKMVQGVFAQEYEGYKRKTRRWL